MTTLFAALIGGVAGSGGTLFGTMLSYVSKNTSNKKTGFIISLAAGLMVGIVSFELMPEAFSYGDITVCAAGFALGVIMALLSGKLVHAHTSLRGNIGAVGISTALAIAVHNFPEGLAIGSGLVASPPLGLALAMVITVHNLPEGMAIGMPLRIGGCTGARASVISALSGLPMAAGALIGFAMGGISPAVLAFSLSLAGGAMMYVVSADMVPRSNELYPGRFGAIGHVLGFSLGALICVGM